MDCERLKILVVDDDIANQKILGKILYKEGYSVMIAGSGEEALDLAKVDQPDLILLDVAMPGMDGFDTCHAINSEVTTTDIPIIFLSALDDVQNKVRAFDVGAVDYICKPFEKAEILARVSLHLKLNFSVKAALEAQAEKLQKLQQAQQAILVTPEEMPEACFGVKYSPVHETGGDFYDVIQIADNIYGYFVADISGHDVGASFITPAVKALLKQYAIPIFSCQEILKGINRILGTMLNNGNHMTAAYTRLNKITNELEIISAGHPPVIIISKDGTENVIELEGDVLGAFENVFFATQTIHVNKGDRIVIYSDGLIEGHGDDKKTRSEGLDDLVAACKQTMGLSVQEAVDEVCSVILPEKHHCTDDTVLLAIDI